MMASDRSQLGVHLDDFRAAPREALRLASTMGFGAVHIGVVDGPLAPRELSESGRRHLKRLATGLGLEIVALRADLGGARLLDTAAVDGHLHRIRDILQLARDMDVPLVTAPLGKFHPDDEREYSLVLQAVAHIAECADTLDRSFAIETAGARGAGWTGCAGGTTRCAGASPGALPKLLQQLSCPHLKICYDPAELLLDGFDPLESVGHLAGDIALAMARDAERGTPNRAGRETNLGNGHLDLQAYLAHLDAAGYHGPWVVRRSNSADPRRDLQICKQYLDSVLGVQSYRGSN